MFRRCRGVDSSAEEVAGVGDIGYALRFENVTKRYPRGGPGYSSLRQELSAGIWSLATRLGGKAVPPRGTLALEDVSFEVGEGESFAIVGPNGAGKSTALKLVSRISYPSSGRVRVVGRVGALIEVASGTHPELSARENIWLYGQILGMSKGEVRKRFDEIVDFAELAEVLDRPVKMYSSGMQLRLGFAIASHLDPDVFVVDEALAVGDAAFQTKCIDRMTKLVAGGRTLVFVSHTLPVVREVCTRGLLLDRGRVLRIGTANEVIDAYLDFVGGAIAARSAEGEAIEVTGVRVFSEQNGSARIATNDPVRLEIDLDVRTPCEDAVLGVGITDGRLSNLIAMTMLSREESVALPVGRHRLLCRTGPLPLLPGSYEMLLVASSESKALNYLEPKIIGMLMISEGPEERRRDQLFPRTGGFGPVYVDYEMRVELFPGPRSS